MDLAFSFVLWLGLGTQVSDASEDTPAWSKRAAVDTSLRGAFVGAHMGAGFLAVKAVTPFLVRYGTGGNLAAITLNLLWPWIGWYAGNAAYDAFKDFTPLGRRISNSKDQAPHPNGAWWKAKTVDASLRVLSPMVIGHLIVEPVAWVFLSRLMPFGWAGRAAAIAGLHAIPWFASNFLYEGLKEFAFKKRPAKTKPTPGSFRWMISTREATNRGLAVGTVALATRLTYHVVHRTTGTPGAFHLILAEPLIAWLGGNLLYEGARKDPSVPLGSWSKQWLADTGGRGGLLLAMVGLDQGAGWIMTKLLLRGTPLPGGTQLILNLTRTSLIWYGGNLLYDRALKDKLAPPRQGRSIAQVLESIDRPAP